MKTNSLASENHFHPFSQIEINFCQWKQFFFKWNIFFSQPSFRLVETSFLSSGNSIFSYFKFFSTNGKY